MVVGAGLSVLIFISVKRTLYRVFGITFIWLFFLLVFQFLCFQSTCKSDLCFQNTINWNNFGYQANIEPIKKKLCVIKWSSVFYIETGILVYCLVYLEDILVASSREIHFFPSQSKFALTTSQKQCNIKCCQNEIVLKSNNLNGMFKWSFW